MPNVDPWVKRVDQGQAHILESNGVKIGEMNSVGRSGRIVAHAATQLLIIQKNFYLWKFPIISDRTTSLSKVAITFCTGTCSAIAAFSYYGILTYWFAS